MNKRQLETDPLDPLDPLDPHDPIEPEEDEEDRLHLWGCQYFLEELFQTTQNQLFTPDQKLIVSDCLMTLSKTLKNRVLSLSSFRAGQVIFKHSMRRFWQSCQPDPILHPLLLSYLRLILDTNHQIRMDSEETHLLVSLFSKEFVAETMCQLIQVGLLHFPYKKFHVSVPRDQLFHNIMTRKLIESEASIFLRLAQPKLRSFFNYRFHGHFLTLISSDDDYHMAEVLTDLYQEECRIKAQRRGQVGSLYDLWKTDPNHQLQEIIQGILEKDQPLHAKELREALYHELGYLECTTFKPILSREMMDRFQATRVLDFSAGWGDRLLGALACPSVTRYVGYDPNHDLEKGHQAMVQNFGRPEIQVSMIYQPFENANVPDEMFDLILTSPPFFDLESYTTMLGQSIQSFPRYEDWLVKFLCASIQKAWSHLSLGGHLVIYLSDSVIQGPSACEVMNLFIESHLEGAQYQGVIAFRGQADTPRPMWIWKRDNVTSSRKCKAESLGKKFYPEIWRNFLLI